MVATPESKRYIAPSMTEEELWDLREPIMIRAETISKSGEDLVWGYDTVNKMPVPANNNQKNHDTRNLKGIISLRDLPALVRGLDY